MTGHYAIAPPTVGLPAFTPPALTTSRRRLVNISSQTPKGHIGKAHLRTDSAPVSAGFYLSNNGPSAELTLLAAAILKAPNREIALLPASSARIEKVTDLMLRSHGRSMHVTEYAIIGLTFTPQVVWLDDDLHFFGSPGKWSALMKQGWEDTNDELYNAELKGEDERYHKMASASPNILHIPLPLRTSAPSILKMQSCMKIRPSLLTKTESPP